METVEITVRLEVVDQATAKEAYEQLICCFAAYEVPADAQDATWKSARRLASYILQHTGKLSEDSDEALQAIFTAKPK